MAGSFTRDSNKFNNMNIMPNPYNTKTLANRLYYYIPIKNIYMEIKHFQRI